MRSHVAHPGRAWTLVSALAGLALLACTGCSHQSGLGNGIVRFTDGEPVTSGSIEFRSTADGERYASLIDPQGKFQLTSEDGSPGLPAGTYEAVVVQIVLTEDLAAELHTHGHTVPRRYADYYTSGLSVSTQNVPADSKLIELVLETI
jgi:hypothetical protein